MNEEAERLAGIEPGDSNEICLAKTMLAIDEANNMTDVSILMPDGVIYAQEVLDARAES